MYYSGVWMTPPPAAAAAAAPTREGRDRLQLRAPLRRLRPRLRQRNLRDGRRLQRHLPRPLDRLQGRVIWRTSDCHFVVQLNHVIPGFLSYLVVAFLKWQSDLSPPQGRAVHHRAQGRHDVRPKRLGAAAACARGLGRPGRHCRSTLPFYTAVLHCR
jgi:hypothetical protein